MYLLVSYHAATHPVHLLSTLPLSRLGFAEAASEPWHLNGVRVSAASVRRRTEADGVVYAMRHLQAGPPPPRRGPAVQQVSVNGAMVTV